MGWGTDRVGEARLLAMAVVVVCERAVRASGDAGWRAESRNFSLVLPVFQSLPQGSGHDSAVLHRARQIYLREMKAFDNVYCIHP